MGAPVAGVAALINASSPAGDIYNGQFCGGVVVSTRVVLTAAHCVADRTSAIDVVVGGDNLCRDRPVDGIRIAVAAIDIHPSYDAESARYDLARLTLAEDAPAVSVRTVASPPATGAATALGWGRSSEGGIPPCRLMRTSLRVLPQTECAAVASGPGRPFDPESMICAMPDRQANDDTCTGDSGGPLLVGDDPQRGGIIGIVSWGRGCGSGWAGVYARVGPWP